MTEPKDPWKYNQQRRLHLLMKHGATGRNTKLPRKQKKALSRRGRKFREQLMAGSFLMLENDSQNLQKEASK